MMLFIKDVMQILGVSDKTVRRMMARGELKVLTFAGRPLKPYRFDEGEIFALLGKASTSSLKTSRKTQSDKPAPTQKWEDIKWA